MEQKPTPERFKNYKIEGNKDLNDLVFEAVRTLPLIKSQKFLKKLFKTEVDIYNTREGEYLTISVGKIKIISRNPNEEGLKTYAE